MRRLVFSVHSLRDQSTLFSKRHFSRQASGKLPVFRLWFCVEKKPLTVSASLSNDAYSKWAYLIVVRGSPYPRTLCPVQ